MKIKNISSVTVQLETLLALRKETMTFVPETKIDPDNGEEYVSKIFCLEQQRDFGVSPFMTVDLLPGYLQSIFPLGRVIVNAGKN